MSASSPEQLFGELLRAAPSKPFVTYYDELSGERSELSLRSLANWVAKTHFLLTDELVLGVGDIAFLALPAHWISVPAVLGCLSAGLALTSSIEEEAAVAFVEPATVALAAGVPDVYVIAPGSAAVGLGDAVPPGTPDSRVLDYVGAVRPQADAWAGVRFGADGGDRCLDGYSRAEVVLRARERATTLGAAPGARVLTTRSWTQLDDLIDTLFVPLAVGGSVVYVRNAPDENVVERRMSQERATVRV